MNNYLYSKDGLIDRTWNPKSEVVQNYIKKHINFQNK